MLHMFMDRRHLTYEQAINEPAEVIERAIMIWKLENIRDRLSTGNRNSN